MNSRIREWLKPRPFNYITVDEIERLAKHLDLSQADLWNLVKSQGYIIANTRDEAEQIFSKIKEIPF